MIRVDRRVSRRIGLSIICLMVCAGFLGILKANGRGPVTGDKLYVKENYKQDLAQMKLTEVAAMPYFTEPFVCAARDDQGKELAVLFRRSGQIDTVALPVSYEDILRHVAPDSEGDKARIAASNLHLFEIGKHLYWSYTDGNGTMYMNLGGEQVTDPFVLEK